jgi:hypothetical protein
MSMPSRRGLRRGAVVAALGLATLVVVPSVMGGTGIGAIFNLGKTNKVNAPTTLTGSSRSPMLKLTNSGTGVALQLTTRTTVAPMKVNSSVKVANLNADKLDGIDSTGFMAAGAHPDAATVQGLDAAALTAPGDIYRTYGPNAWAVNAASPSSLASAYLDAVNLHSNASGVGYFHIAPETPALENGWQYAIKSVKVCWSYVQTATVTSIDLYTFVAGDTVAIETGHAGAAPASAAPGCAMVELASPVPGGHAAFAMTVNFNGANGGRLFVGDATVRWIPVAPAIAPANVSAAVPMDGPVDPAGLAPTH